MLLGVLLTVCCAGGAHSVRPNAQHKKDAKRFGLQKPQSGRIVSFGKSGHTRDAIRRFNSAHSGGFNLRFGPSGVGDPKAGRARRERGEMLWKAATIAREQGLELFGTEIEPDWRVLRGNYKGHEIPDERGTAHERGRRKRHKVRLEKRWHYRYVASEIAWDALALMPEQTERTARRFCIAGSWLKVRDDQAADRFYKALVRRCGKTELGKTADKLRWFPKLDKKE